MSSNNYIKFENGSKIKFYTSTANVRSKRSELISFYCNECKEVHEDYPVKNIQWFGDNIMICKESYEEVLKPYSNI